MKKVWVLFMVVVMVFVVTRAGETGEINVLVWDDAHTQSVETQIADFETATGIKVNFERQPTKSIFEKMAIAVTAESSEYDLVAIDEPFVPMFAELMSEYEEWPAGKTFAKIGFNDVPAKAFEAGQWDGQNKGLPINGNVYVWMTRKDIIDDPTNQKEFKEKYGYDLGVPQTFDQLVDIGTFLKDKGVFGFGPFTRKAEGVTAEAICYFESYGTTVLAREGGKYSVVLNKTQAVEAINMYKTLMALAPKGSADWHHAERSAAFSMGQVFSMFQWPSMIPAHENAEKSQVAGKIIYSAPPSGPSKRAAVRGCWILAIPKSAENKADAAEFAYWWGSYQSGKKLVEAGMTPVRIDLLTDPDLTATRPWYAAILESMNNAVNRPRFDHYAELSDVIQINWMAAVTGTMTPEEAVDKIIAGTQNVLKKYGY